MKNKLNHEFIIKTILDNGGTIYAGYVREWILNDEPVDAGWTDIDCSFKDEDKVPLVLKILTEELGDKKPLIDIKPQSFYYFNLFWCNSWLYDGVIKLINYGNIIASQKDKSIKNRYELTMNETKSKIATCIVPFQHASKQRERIKKFIENGWTIFDASGELVDDIMLKTKNIYRNKLNGM